MRRRGGALLLGSFCVGFAACTSPQPSTTTPSTLAAAANRGRGIYAAKCAECHGVDGKGDGPAAGHLKPAPRDFTAGKFKIRSTESGSLPTDGDLVAAIERGLPGTSMPGWRGLLPDPEIADVAQYIKSFSPRFASEQPVPVTLIDQTASAPEAVARGASVYERLQCGKCHGADGRATDTVARSFVDDWGQPVSIADLSEPWTFRGGPSPRDIYLRFRTGMSGSPMPSFKDAASDADLWDLAYYVASLARKPLWEMNAAEVSAHYAREEAEARGNPIDRGEYLVQTRLCPICHSPVDESGRILPGLRMAGGQRVRIGPFGDYVTGNLTSDKETGIGAWSDDELKAAITRGTLRDGTRLPPFPMDYPALSALSSDDLNAIVAYLRTIPPVFNRVPPPRRPALPLYLWGKFRMLVLGTDPPMVFFAGNAGERR
jgi:mono/diheme cytochrome c family protein